MEKDTSGKEKIPPKQTNVSEGRSGEKGEKYDTLDGNEAGGGGGEVGEDTPSTPSTNWLRGQTKNSLLAHRQSPLPAWKKISLHLNIMNRYPQGE